MDRTPNHYRQTYDTAKAESATRYTPGGSISTRPPEHPDWGSTRRAEAILPGIQEALWDVPVSAPIRRRNSMVARTPRGCGYLWHLPSVRLIKRLRMAAGTSTRTAIRVYDALRADRALVEAIVNTDPAG